MAQLAVQQLTQAGQTVTTAAAAAGGDQFVNTGHEILEVMNASASPITVTIHQQMPCDLGGVSPTHDLVVSVAAGATDLIGPIDVGHYNDASGNVHVAYSAVTSVTVGVFRAR